MQQERDLRSNKLKKRISKSKMEVVIMSLGRGALGRSGEDVTEVVPRMKTNAMHMVLINTMPGLQHITKKQKTTIITPVIRRNKQKQHHVK
jgi:hypothetical protein